MGETGFADQEFADDCWRACIANLIGEPIGNVPNFVRDNARNWLRDTQKWLRRKGLTLQNLPPDWPIEAARPYVILVGDSLQPHALFHAVLGDAATGEIVHDPHPSRLGLWTVAAVYAARRCS